MKKQRVSLYGAFLVIVCVLVYTGYRKQMSAENAPVTVSIWHVYGAQTDSPLNDLIEEFNRTEGKKKGVQVEVTSVSNNNTIHEGILAAVNKEPGALQLPDMFVSYPKTVLAMPDSDILVDYRDYFTEEEFEAFFDVFLEEGIIEDRQVILPVAKSTEVMLYNKTAFERFAAATGAKSADMQTWEGLFAMAEEYEKWCGNPFLVHDFHFNYAQVGVESLGGDFFKNDTISFDRYFDDVWEPYAKAAIEGGIWLQSGYATEPLRTGDAIISVVSSASVLYYSDQVTYPDNTSEQIEIAAMPCPVFENGEKLVMQRGAGICTVKSTPKKEEACMTFLKWITAPEKNVEFVTQTGYMPVTEEAFENYLPKFIEKLEDPKYRELYEVLLEMRETFQFYTPPQMERYLELETVFEKNVRLYLNMERQEYLAEEENPTERNARVQAACQKIKALY